MCLAKYSFFFTHTSPFASTILNYYSKFITKYTFFYKNYSI